MFLEEKYNDYPFNLLKLLAVKMTKISYFSVKKKIIIKMFKSFRKVCNSFENCLKSFDIFGSQILLNIKE